MNEPAAANLTQDLAAAGFLCLGGFSPETGSNVPHLSGGTAPGTLFLIGSTGPSLWPHLTRSPEFEDGDPDPLDRYTKRILSACAAQHGFEALFPFEGPPYYPFQQWALRCGGFSKSPLGVLAHAEYGPWTGFRAALLSADRLTGTPQVPEKGPCENCSDKPCLTVCPVNAISLEQGYRADACRNHLAEHRDHACWTGCLARHACPFGRDHRQSAGTARFHMERFVGP